MSVSLGITLYNPARLGDDSFVAGFIARQEILRQLLNLLRSIDANAAGKHVLIVGARGLGKTSLLRRLAIGVAQDTALARHYIPLRFREEQYNVLTLEDFWGNCCEALAEWCEQNGQLDAAARLDDQGAQPNWRDKGIAQAAFLTASASLGRRAILLADNLDIIIDAIAEKQQDWAFRAALQEPRGPILIGASTQFLRQDSDREAAFYEFFTPILLEPLEKEELFDCLRSLANARGEKGAAVRNILDHDPARLQTLYELTGGNPRVLTLIYSLLESSETESVFADLELLLDQVTPYYKARIEEYQGKLQKAVIDGIALHWDPITSGALAEVTGVEATTLSGQLIRLRKDGLIQEVETSRGRTGFMLVERFLNIWYLMRHGTRRTRQRMLWLTRFMVQFYRPDELQRLSLQCEAGVTQVPPHPLYREALASALEMTCAPPLLKGNEFPISSEREQNTKSLSVLNIGAETHDEIAWSDVPDDSEAAIDFYDQIINELEEAENSIAWARALISKCIVLLQLGRAEEALNACDAVVARFGEVATPALQMWVALGLLSKAISLAQLGRVEEALVAYDAAVIQLGEPENLPVQVLVVQAMLGKSIALGELGRAEEAVLAYDAVVALFGSVTEPAIQELVARALVNKGFSLRQLNRAEEALTAYEIVVNRFDVVTEFAMQSQVARAMLGKGVVLGQLGRVEEALAAYDAVVARFDAVTEPAMQSQVARALVNKGVALGELGRAEEALAAYDTVEVRFTEAADPAMQMQVARAMLGKGVVLGEQGRMEDALAAYAAVAARFDVVTESALQELVARALINKGVALGELGSAEEALAAYEAAAARLSAVTEPTVQETIAGVLFNKGVTLRKLGRAEEAFAAYDAVVARFGAATEPAIQVLVARALVNKGVALFQSGRAEEALLAYETVVARFGVVKESTMQAQVVRAMFGKSVALGELGHMEGALASCDALVARFGAVTEPAMQEWVARALMQRGDILSDSLFRREEALSAYVAAREVAGGSTELFVEENIAWLMLAEGKLAEAKALYSKAGSLVPPGSLLLAAGIELVADNFAQALCHLDQALAQNLEPSGVSYTDDLYRLLRIAKARGHGERLIAWFEESGQAEKQAPIYAAFVAYIHGKKKLLDVNPEVRRPAKIIYELLTGKWSQPDVPASADKPRRRGRPRKRPAG